MRSTASISVFGGKQMLGNVSPSSCAQSVCGIAILVEHAGRLVTHGELLESLWPHTHVQPEVLKAMYYRSETHSETIPKTLFISSPLIELARAPGDSGVRGRRPSPHRMFQFTKWSDLEKGWCRRFFGLHI